ncbi:MAG: hypothetical protein R3C03_14190 [Pirellulaceae bacterium]
MFSDFDINHPIADLAAIQALNPHRFEFSLLDAILFEDMEGGRCVGMKMWAKMSIGCVLLRNMR